MRSFLLAATAAAFLLASGPAYAVDCPVSFDPGPPAGFIATCPDPAAPPAQRDYTDAIALSLAMAAPTYLGDKENFAITGNWGMFDEAHAFAVTGIARLGTNLSVNGGVGYAPDSQELGYRAGVRLGW